MKYSEATDSWQSEFAEKIPSTNIRCEIPYRIDRHIYESVMKDNGQQVRFKDTDAVTFTFDIDTAPVGECHPDALFVWPQNSPEGSEDMYDCILFRKEWGQVEDFSAFINELKGCITGVDLKCADELRNEIMDEIEDKIGDMCRLAAIVQNEREKFDV